MSLRNSNKEKRPKEKKTKEKKVKEPKVKKEKKSKRKKGSQPEDSEPIFTEVTDDQPREPKQSRNKKPPANANIYTLVLLIAWLALVAACVLAYLDLASYK